MSSQIKRSWVNHDCGLGVSSECRTSSVGESRGEVSVCLFREGECAFPMVKGWSKDRMLRWRQAVDDRGFREVSPSLEPREQE